MKKSLKKDLQKMWIELQVSEDTCKIHDTYLCPKCFDLTPTNIPKK